MKYFEKHLKSTDSAEDIDISVHCDVTIFELLMNYINERNPKLTKQNVIPILISAEFLVIRRLIDECIGFIIDYIGDIVKGNMDLSCLSQNIIRKISDNISLEQLNNFKDPRDNLQSKIYAHKLDDLLKVDKNKLLRCIHCNVLYTEEQSKWMTCPKAGIFIDYRGRVIANHFPDSNWRIDDFFGFLKKNGVSWRKIFWKVWARLVADECNECGQNFVLAEAENCTYHSEEPIFLYGSNTGSYPCCQAEAVRFSTGVKSGGCKNKKHSFKHMDEESSEYIFFMKHYEYLKEPFSKTLIQTNESKSELREEESKSSIAPMKHKAMSLLRLVKEYASSKKSRSKNGNCAECLSLGTCCNECLMMEDEDDDTPDFNFVLPKKFKPSQGPNVKKDKDNKSMPDLVKKTSNTKTAGKYKLWKMDYFRDKDKEAMDDITKQLRRQRKRNKSNILKSLGKPANKMTTKPSTKLVTKGVSRPSAKSSSKSTNKAGGKYKTKGHYGGVKGR